MTSIEQVFRTEWPRLVATLVRDLRDIELVEDCAQEAFTRAAESWTSDSWPDQPGAWLLTTARRRAIDLLRRAKRYDAKLAVLETAARDRAPGRVDRLVDDQLALLLGCCHPALNIDAQVALTLRVVAGLSTAEIAQAFLVSEATMAKRLTRAKTKIKKANIAFVSPGPAELRQRLESVLYVIYLIFTEGHSSSRPAELVRGDLCDEAIWLSKLLCELVPDQAEVLGLAALIQLTDARRDARTDSHGAMVLLEDQDRGRWNRDKTATGLDLLRAAHETGQPIGPYVLQGGVAAVHALAPSFEATDWAAIVEIYDRLAIESGTTIVLLNRAVALSYLTGPEPALEELDRLGVGGRLDDYLYFHSSRAELLRRLGRVDEAGAAYQVALELCTNDAERGFLTRRLSDLFG